MMNRLLMGLLATLAASALMPTRAEAQRRGGGTVNTPFGQFSSGDMQAAGGNPYAAGAMRQQKMEMMYEQQMFKQQQQSILQMAKQQKARQDYLKKHPEAAKAEADTQAAARARAQPRRKSAASKSSKAAARSTPEATKAAATK